MDWQALLNQTRIEVSTDDPDSQGETDTGDIISAAPSQSNHLAASGPEDELKSFRL
jgi:hypothetical protein